MSGETVDQLWNSLVDQHMDAIWGIATWQGLEPPWWPRVRHSLAEFGWRASGAWSDFTDWVRLGR